MRITAESATTSEVSYGSIRIGSDPDFCANLRLQNPIAPESKGKCGDAGVVESAKPLKPPLCNWSDHNCLAGGVGKSLASWVRTIHMPGIMS